MTTPSAPSMDDTENIPAPLRGCLYCHAEATISVTEGRKLFGIVGSSLPTLTCSECHSTALFEAGEDVATWRIKYRSVNRSARFYYVMIHLGDAGWLTAEEAMQASLNGFVQRQRVQQAKRGNLSWLSPAPLDAPPPLMAPDELVYLTAASAVIAQAAKSSGVLGANEDNVLDSGQFYVTDRKVHLLGHRRDWSHRLSDVARVDYTENDWRIYVGDSNQYYQGTNQLDQIDAQLFTTVVKALLKTGEPADEAENDPT